MDIGRDGHGMGGGGGEGGREDFVRGWGWGWMREYEDGLTRDCPRRGHLDRQPAAGWGRAVWLLRGYSLHSGLVDWLIVDWTTSPCLSRYHCSFSLHIVLT